MCVCWVNPQEICERRYLVINCWLFICLCPNPPQASRVYLAALSKLKAIAQQSDLPRSFPFLQRLILQNCIHILLPNLNLIVR